MKLKNIFLTLALAISTMTVFGQTTAPDATKPYVIFDSTYTLESTGSSSNTEFDIYYDNTSGNAVKGIQFSFNYDNTVFDEPTVTYNNTSGPVGYLSYDVDSTNGVVKVVWVYTGASTTFNMITGNMFTVNAPFLSGYTNGAVADVDFMQPDLWIIHLCRPFQSIWPSIRTCKSAAVSRIRASTSR